MSISVVNVLICTNLRKPVVLLSDRRLSSAEKPTEAETSSFNAMKICKKEDFEAQLIFL